jgi:hypothetical protein
MFDLVDPANDLITIQCGEILSLPESVRDGIAGQLP